MMQVCSCGAMSGLTVDPKCPIHGEPPATKITVVAPTHGQFECILCRIKGMVCGCTFPECIGACSVYPVVCSMCQGKPEAEIQAAVEYWKKNREGRVQTMDGQHLTMDEYAARSGGRIR